jgi:hypothetical protein
MYTKTYTPSYLYYYMLLLRYLVEVHTDALSVKYVCAYADFRNCHYLLMTTLLLGQPLFSSRFEFMLAMMT